MFSYCYAPLISPLSPERCCQTLHENTGFCEMKMKEGVLISTFPIHLQIECICWLKSLSMHYDVKVLHLCPAETKPSSNGCRRALHNKPCSTPVGRPRPARATQSYLQRQHDKILNAPMKILSIFTRRSHISTDGISMCARGCVLHVHLLFHSKNPSSLHHRRHIKVKGCIVWPPPFPPYPSGFNTVEQIHQ